MPQFSIFSGSTLRPISRLAIVSGGVTRQLKKLSVMDGGTLKPVGLFTGALSLTANDVANPLHGGATTSTSTAVVSGGAGPYTYSWVILTGSATIDFPTSASTSFTKPDWNNGDIVTARVTVTDSFGSMATADVSARWRDIDLGPS